MATAWIIGIGLIILVISVLFYQHIPGSSSGDSTDDGPHGDDNQ